MPNDNYDSYGDDQDELEELTEKIQYGDRSEGAEALQKVIERARGDNRNMGQAVRAEIATMGLQRETQAALTKFAKRYPALVQDEDLADVGKRALVREIGNDLIAAGVPEETIAASRGDTDKMVGAWGYARAHGMKVRSADDLLDATGRHLSQKYAIKPARQDPREVVRDMRTARNFKNDDGYIAPARPEASAAEEARRDRVRKHINEARIARGFRTFE